VIYDPKKKWTVTLDALHMDSDYSCWENWEMTGKPRTVARRGKVLIRDEQLVGDLGQGEFLPRKMDASVLNGRPATPTSELEDVQLTPAT
jgi:dihydropyrimidinase